MSFYIRKSIRFGPIRVNISKSGIGISGGVTGARISTGPTGTYINVGRGGLYYRRKIDGSVDNLTSARKEPPSKPYAPDMSDWVGTSNRDLLQQINSRIRQPSYVFLVLLSSTIFALAVASLTYFIQLDRERFLENSYPNLLLVPIFAAILIWLVGILA